MTRNKKMIIVIGAIVAVIVIALIIVFLIHESNSGGTGTTPPSGTLPPVATNTPATTIPTSTTLTFGTSNGNVTTSNFYQSADFITQDQQSVAIQDTPDYIIVYNVGDSSFTITLMSTPLEAARQAAEAAFLSSLGISQAAACKLTVYEGVPASVSDEYVGQDFSLSFCGGPATL